MLHVLVVFRYVCQIASDCRHSRNTDGLLVYEKRRVKFAIANRPNKLRWLIMLIEVN